MAYLRLVAILVWFVLVCFLGLVLALFRWGDLNLDHDLARMFSWGMCGITRVTVLVEGEERLAQHQPCIYVANHQSAFDLATFGRICPRRVIVIGKKELIWIPLFGLLFAAAGNIMIDRRRRDRAIAGLSQAVEALRNRGASIWLFPEGTRNTSGQGLLPFKKGAFHMAIAASVPIVPVVSSPILPIVNWKEGRLGGGIVRLRVLPAVPTTGLDTADVDALAARVREEMLDGQRGLVSEPT
jgi:1-acyl-sn-glycerol-3-phosphate acyltransferase